jgi:hypothetical protein
MGNLNCVRHNGVERIALQRTDTAKKAVPSVCRGTRYTVWYTAMLGARDPDGRRRADGKSKKGALGHEYDVLLHIPRRRSRLEPFKVGGFGRQYGSLGGITHASVTQTATPSQGKHEEQKNPKPLPSTLVSVWDSQRPGPSMEYGVTRGS